MPNQPGSTPKGHVAARTGLGSALWQAWVSPRFTLVLFLVLAFFSVLSLLIAQSGTSPVPLEKIYAPDVLEILRVSGFTDIFHSLWFVFILTLMALNQVMVLIDRIPGAWKEASRRAPAAIETKAAWENPEAGFAAEMTTAIGRDAFREGVSRVRNRRFPLPLPVRDSSEELQLSGQSGRFSRLVVLFAHVGFLVLILGGVIESIGAFDGQIILEENARANAIQILRGNTQNWPVLRQNGREIPGYFEPGFEIELTKVDPERSASAIRYYQGGKLADSREVRVNRPVVYNGLHFFQRDLARTSQTQVILRVSSEATGDLEREQHLIRWQKYDLEGASFLIEETQESPELGATIRIAYQETGSEPEHFWIFQKFPDYDRAHRKKSRYHFSLPPDGQPVSPRYSSTLRATRNPGLGFIFAGTAMLALGLLVSAFLRPNRFWFVWNEGRIRIHAQSSRPSLLSPDFARAVRDVRDALAKADPSIGEAEIRHGTS